MSYESLYSLEHSVIFRESFRDSYSVQSNYYIKGVISSGIKFINGRVVFSKSIGTISYNNPKIAFRHTSGVRTYRIKFNLDFQKFDANYQFLFVINAAFSNNLYVRYTPSGLLNFNNKINSLRNYFGDVELILVNNILNNSSKLYVNGDFQGSSTSVVTLPTNYGLEFGNYTGSSTLQFKGSMELFEIYNKELSATEVKLIFSQQLYSNIY